MSRVFVRLFQHLFTSFLLLLTPDSACPLLWGYSGDDVISSMPQSLQNCFVSSATSCGPLSLYNISGTEVSINAERSPAITSLARADRPNIKVDAQPEYTSVTTRNC